MTHFTKPNVQCYNNKILIVKHIML